MSEVGYQSVAEALSAPEVGEVMAGWKDKFDALRDAVLGEGGAAEQFADRVREALPEELRDAELSPKGAADLILFVDSKGLLFGPSLAPIKDIAERIKNDEPVPPTVLIRAAAMLLRSSVIKTALGDELHGKVSGSADRAAAAASTIDMARRMGKASNVPQKPANPPIAKSPTPKASAPTGGRAARAVEFDATIAAQLCNPDAPETSIETDFVHLLIHHKSNQTEPSDRLSGYEIPEGRLFSNTVDNKTVWMLDGSGDIGITSVRGVVSETFDGRVAVYEVNVTFQDRPDAATQQPTASYHVIERYQLTGVGAATKIHYSGSRWHTANAGFALPAGAPTDPKWLRSPQQLLALAAQGQTAALTYQGPQPGKGLE